MAKTLIIIPLFCVYIIYTDIHRVNVSPSSIPPTVIRLLKEICGSLSLRGTCRYRLMSLPPNVLSEGLCQAEDNPSCDVTIEA